MILSLSLFFFGSHPPSPLIFTPSPARDFWSWRSSGFKVFASGGNLLAKPAQGDFAFFRCTPASVSHMEWVGDDGTTKRPQLTKDLLRQCDRLYAGGLSPQIVACVRDWDGVSIPKRAQLLALFGLRKRHPGDSCEEVAEAIRRFTGPLHMRLVIRLTSADELPQCKALAQRLDIWKPDFQPVVWGATQEDRTMVGEARETALMGADVLVLPCEEVETVEKFILPQVQPPAPGNDVLEDDERPSVSLLVNRSLPFYQGLVPIAATREEEAWLWQWGGLQDDFVPFLAVGDRLLSKTTGSLRASTHVFFNSIWIVSPRDDALTLFFCGIGGGPCTVAPATSLCSGAQQSASVLLLNGSLNVFSKLLENVHAGKCIPHKWDDSSSSSLSSPSLPSLSQGGGGGQPGLQNNNANNTKCLLM